MILQGGNFGVDTEFIKAVFQESINQGFSTLAYNFPYYDRGDSVTSDECQEEVKTVHEAVDFLLSTGAKEIMIIAKSVGSVVAGKFLSKSSNVQISSIVILGVPLKYIRFEEFAGQKLQIVHGELDKFGDSKAVQDAVLSAGIKATITPIPDADHSFRDESGNEPGKQKQAIEAIDWGKK